MCGGRSSILHYGPLIETNYLYAPTPNGQKPECVAKQTQYPPPCLRNITEMFVVDRSFDFDRAMLDRRLLDLGFSYAILGFITCTF